MLKFFVYKVCIDIESSVNKIIIKFKCLYYIFFFFKIEKNLLKKNKEEK